MQKAIWLGAGTLWLLASLSSWIAIWPPWVLPAPYRVIDAALALLGLLAVIATGYLAVMWQAEQPAAYWRTGAAAGAWLAPLVVAGWLLRTWLLGGFSGVESLTWLGILGRVLLGTGAGRRRAGADHGAGGCVGRLAGWPPLIRAVVPCFDPGRHCGSACCSCWLRP